MGLLWPKKRPKLSKDQEYIFGWWQWGQTIGHWRPNSLTQRHARPATQPCMAGCRVLHYCSLASGLQGCCSCVVLYGCMVRYFICIAQEKEDCFFRIRINDNQGQGEIYLHTRLDLSEQVWNTMFKFQGWKLWVLVRQNGLFLNVEWLPYVWTFLLYIRNPTTI